MHIHRSGKPCNCGFHPTEKRIPKLDQGGYPLTSHQARKVEQALKSCPECGHELYPTGECPWCDHEQRSNTDWNLAQDSIPYPFKDENQGR